MNAAGIITEFNPFHSGHAYLLKEVRRLSGADLIVIIMSGDFVQRGEPAVFDKYTRTELALKGGADLVFELPVRFCLSSAGDFALGGILALESLGFVTDLYFGSECGEIAPLMKIADTLFKEEKNENSTYSTALKSALKQGLSYPAARANALSADGICNEPNNILGIEYCYALQKLNSSIQPHTLLRKGQHYSDSTVMDSDSTCHPSATALRRRIHQTDTPHLAMNDFSEIIGYAILQENNLAKYKDISPDLARRIKNLATNYQSASGFIKDCQTRTFTEGRIRRSLFQCVLGLTETDLSMPYLRLLGCTDAAMRKMHRYFAENVPKSKILTRLATDVKALDEHAHSLFDKDIFASDLYRQVWQEKYHVLLPNEYQHLSVVRP